MSLLVARTEWYPVFYGRGYRIQQFPMLLALSDVAHATYNSPYAIRFLFTAAGTGVA
jgi:hypothetical protein